MRVCGYGGRPPPSRALLATGLLRHPLTEPDAGALSILVDEQAPGTNFTGATSGFDVVAVSNIRPPRKQWKTERLSIICFHILGRILEVQVPANQMAAHDRE